MPDMYANISSYFNVSQDDDNEALYFTLPFDPS
jgi:hypothetical protein